VTLICLGRIHLLRLRKTHPSHRHIISGPILHYTQLCIQLLRNPCSRRVERILGSLDAVGLGLSLSASTSIAAEHRRAETVSRALQVSSICLSASSQSNQFAYHQISDHEGLLNSQRCSSGRCGPFCHGERS
jgi:hypothetical protein